MFTALKTSSRTVDVQHLLLDLWKTGLTSDEIAVRAGMEPLAVVQLVYSVATFAWLVAERLMYAGCGLDTVVALSDLPIKVVEMIFEDHGIVPLDQNSSQVDLATS
jgi:hypothetical protein